MTLKEFETSIDVLFKNAMASIDDIWKDYQNLTNSNK